MKIYANYTGIEAYGIYYSFEQGEVSLSDMCDVVINCRAETKKREIILKLFSITHITKFTPEQSNLIERLYNHTFVNSLPSRWFGELRNILKSSNLRQEKKDEITQRIFNNKKFNPEYCKSITGLVNRETLLDKIEEMLNKSFKSFHAGEVYEWLNVLRMNDVFVNKEIKKQYFLKYKEIFLKGAEQRQRNDFLIMFRDVLDDESKYNYEYSVITRALGGYSKSFDVAKQSDISNSMVLKYLVDYITNKEIDFPEELIELIDAYEVAKKLTKK